MLFLWSLLLLKLLPPLWHTQRIHILLSVHLWLTLLTLLRAYKCDTILSCYLSQNFLICSDFSWSQPRTLARILLFCLCGNCNITRFLRCPWKQCVLMLIFEILGPAVAMLLPLISLFYLLWQWQWQCWLWRLKFLLFLPWWLCQWDDEMWH